LCPEFIDLAGSFEVAGDVALVVRGDVEAFALAHAFAKIIGLTGTFRGSRRLSEIAETLNAEVTKMEVPLKEESSKTGRREIANASY
jgi:hypothetical protein